MFRTVELPLWLFLLILVFAAVTFASHFLFPSVRWYLRRRLERAVARLNTRLKVPIQPFKLARRHDTIRRLLFDPEVAQAVIDHARENHVREDVAHQTAERYAREIVPGFSASLYFGIAARAAKWLATLLYDVRIVHYHDSLSKVDSNATVVFVMNHRSNMDYVLVTYLASSRTAIAYAVGEWARVVPLRWLIRPMGGYFVRRKQSNDLYRRVLARYVALATENGVTQAVFPEGGLTRDGALQEPKLGILSYITGGFDPAERDVIFVPVGLNYDRVLEDRTLIAAGKDGHRNYRSPVYTLFSFVGRHLRRALTGKFQKYGTAGVGFGAPLSLTEFLKRRHKDPVAALGKELMARISDQVPLLPVPLVSRLLLDGAVARSDLTRGIEAAITRRAGAADSLETLDPAKTCEAGLAHLALRGLVSETDGGVTIEPGAEEVLAYYAASIGQHFPRKPQNRKSFAQK